MDGKTYLGCLGVFAVLALLSGASAGAVGLLVASKFIGVLVIAGIIGLGLLATSRRE